MSPVVPICTPTYFPARSSTENTVFSGILLPQAVSVNVLARLNTSTTESIKRRLNVESFLVFIILILSFNNYTQIMYHISMIKSKIINIELY